MDDLEHFQHWRANLDEFYQRQASELIELFEKKKSVV